jgi:hypothetical protein
MRLAVMLTVLILVAVTTSVVAGKMFKGRR